MAISDTHFLGGTLFIAATDPDLINICRGFSYPYLDSVAIDLSVQVDAADMPYALHKLQKLLAALHQLQLDKNNKKHPYLFIQIPNPESFETINCLQHIELCQGFILPNFDEHNMQAYMNYYIPDKYYQPILNSPILDHKRLSQIAMFLQQYQKNILAIRLGDGLLKQWHIHYNSYKSYHDVSLIQQLIAHYLIHFLVLEVQITAPAYLCIDPNHQNNFKQEIQRDLNQGLWGKTLINPIQIDWFNQAYQVTKTDFNISKRLLDSYCPASFIYEQQLYNKQNAQQWAKSILKRADLYGIQV